MNVLKHIVRFCMMLALSMLMVACTQPTSDAGGLQDEFEVALGFPRDKAATGKSTINDDAYVEKVYVKVYNSSNVHLPAIDATSDISGVTKLSYDGVGGKWSATVKLAAPASGTITFEVWAVNSLVERMYEGATRHTVGENGNSVTLAIQAYVYAIRSTGPAGGLVFYDKGSYSGGWRYLEAAPAGWSGASADPKYIFGYYHTTDNNSSLTVGTGTAIGTGEANTIALVSAMGDMAYVGASGTAKASYVAKVCADYTGGGYDDWFLPSWEELYLIYQNLLNQSVGGFSRDTYWSSSEGSELNSYFVSFYNSSRWVIQRYYAYCVRPIRAF